MNTRSKSNPFAQSPQYWKVTVPLSTTLIKAAEESFDDIAMSVAGFEVDEAKGQWEFELLFTAKPDIEEINRRLMVLAKLHNVPLPQAKVEKLEPTDWLAKVAKDFPPLSIGRFYIYGSHVENPPPAGSIPIKIDAGAAFGSGEHGTTHCCLEALDWLARARNFRNILDMGCGSGILGIAAAKLWKAPVLAADIDPIAVRVTEDNVRINREQAFVTCAVSDGYASDTIRRKAPFDIIVSNILARPLVEFAPALAKNLVANGVAVLSGLLTSQETQVLSAHLTQGLKLRRRFVYNEWCTLVLER
jgi:ribosomal protein L11 methyltransferase